MVLFLEFYTSFIAKMAHRKIVVFFIFFYVFNPPQCFARPQNLLADFLIFRRDSCQSDSVKSLKILVVKITYEYRVSVTQHLRIIDVRILIGVHQIIKKRLVKRHYTL